MRKESLPCATSPEGVRGGSRTAGPHEQPRQAEIADLGVGVSTLTRWLAHRRDRQMEAPERPPPGEEVAAELKRLRRENQILRQERDILNKAMALFVEEGNREVPAHRHGEEGIPRPEALQGARRQRERLLSLESRPACRRQR